MKYVIFETHTRKGTIEFGLIFPEFIIHAELSKSIERHMLANTTFSAKPIAAGFCSHLHDGLTLFCSGMSESLGLRSRGDVDAALLRKHLPMGTLE